MAALKNNLVKIFIGYTLSFPTKIRIIFTKKCLKSDIFKIKRYLLIYTAPKKLDTFGGIFMARKVKYDVTY
ncbi:hypothetical protein OBK13_08315, partial [Empedobacter falsenii]